MTPRLRLTLATMITVLCISIGSARATPRIIYVDHAATGGANDGSNWNDAFINLEDALTNATPDNGPEFDQIWVAEGSYLAGLSSSDAFRMPSGVKLYGAFANGSTNLSDANTSTHPTILTGDFGTGLCDVVLTFTDVSGDTRIQGFTIEKAAVHGVGVSIDAGPVSAPTLDLLLVQSNGNYSTGVGGGIAVTGGASPLITRCTLTANMALRGGGLAIDSASRATVTGCHIYSNAANFNSLAGGGGGGVYSEANTNGKPVIVFRSCLF